MTARGWMALCGVVLAQCQKTPEEPIRRTVEIPAPTALAGEVASATVPPRDAATPRAKPACIDKNVITATPAPRPAAVCPPAPTPNLKLERLVMRGEDAGVRFDVELAKGNEATQRGMMWRTSMGENEGMLFDLESRYVHAFWMRNTCLPLDMLFIDEDGTIVGIVENVPVLNDLERRVSCPSRFVLELNAGVARKRGLLPGQRMSWN